MRKPSNGYSINCQEHTLSILEKIKVYCTGMAGHYLPPNAGITRMEYVEFLPRRLRILYLIQSGWSVCVRCLFAFEGTIDNSADLTERLPAEDHGSFRKCVEGAYYLLSKSTDPYQRPVCIFGSFLRHRHARLDLRCEQTALRLPASACVPG